MLRFFSAVVALIWALAVSPAQAGCSRADVEFYLNQGFKNDQIVSLCGSASGGEQRSSSRRDRDDRGDERRSVSREREEDEIFLRTAIEAYDIEITEEHIAFTRKQCVEFGWKDWNGFRETGCPHVRYIIPLKGMQVLEAKKEFYFFGAGVVKVSGNIQQDVLNADEFPAKHRKEMLEALQLKTKVLDLDIRSGMPIYKVEGMLRSLAS